jgi:hypothetical protein
MGKLVDIAKSIEERTMFQDRVVAMQKALDKVLNKYPKVDEQDIVIFAKIYGAIVPEDIKSIAKIISKVKVKNGR